MICPNCSYKQRDNSTECQRCGIIFSRYYQHRQKRKEVGAAGSDNAPDQSSGVTNSLLDYLLYTREDVNVVAWLGRVLILCGMLYFGIRFILSPIEGNYAGQSFWHLISLPFHEAGHVLFRPFGRFMTSLGGSLLQLIIPLVCLFSLLVKTRDTFGAAVALWWFGQNFFDLAPYINDARALSLPLLGGNYGHSSPYGFHDWEYLLTEAGLLEYDHFIAGMSVVTGTILILVALAWGAVLLYKQYQNCL